MAYQPKGAASLAASYFNLANPGTYNAAPGTAPSLGQRLTGGRSTQLILSGVGDRRSSGRYKQDI